MKFDPATACDLAVATERMKRLAHAVLGNEHDAEDAAQDAWQRALNLGRGVGDSEAWLAGVARNVARERRRASARRRSREGTAAKPETRPPDQVALDQIDSLQSLVAAVRALDEPYRSALVLRYVLGLSPADAAEALDINRSTLRSHVHRGLAHVRVSLDRRNRDGRPWQASIAPLLAGNTAAALTGGLVMSKSTSVLGAAVLLTLLAVAGYAFFPDTDADGDSATSQQHLQRARGADPQLEAPTAELEAPEKADRSLATAAPSDDGPTRARYSLRVLVRPENPSIEYDYGASWVYAVLSSASAAPRGENADGVRALWRRDAEGVTLILPSRGPWIIGVNTDWGIAPIQTVEFEQSGKKEIVLHLPDPEVHRREPITVVVDHDGMDPAEAIRPIVRLAARQVTDLAYSRYPRPGEHPYPRVRSTPVAWGEMTDIACHAAGSFDVSVVLTPTPRSSAANLLVGPKSVEAAPGDSIRFRVQKAGTLIVHVAGLAAADRDVQLPRFQLRPAIPDEANTARADRHDTTGGASFAATPGTWDLTWAGRGWESGAERAIVVRAGAVQVQEVVIVRSAEAPPVPAVSPSSIRGSSASRLRSRYSIRIEGLDSLGPAMERGFDFYGLARDAKDRQHVVRAAWVEIEREGDLLPVEDLSTASGLDDDWTTLDAVQAVRLPWRVARLTRGPSPGRAETARFTKGGFLVVVPSRYPRDASLRLTASDEGLLTTVHPERWRAREPEGMDQAGRSIAIGPGTMVGPLPPGEYEFGVTLGGAEVCKVRGRVEVGRINAMAIDLGDS